MSTSVVLGRVVRFLVDQEMVEQAVGLVSCMEGREHLAVFVTVRDAAEGFGNGRAVAGQAVADVEEGISDSWIAAFGDMTKAAGVTTLGKDGVKTGKSPNVVC